MQGSFKESRKFFGLLAFSLICSWLASSCSDSAVSSVNGADPGVLEAPVAYVKRPIPVDEDEEEIQSDLRDPLFFAAGGDVYLRSNSTVTADERNLTADITLGTGDVKDLSADFDGKQLVFSLRLEDPEPNDDEVPSWNIYVYDLEDNSLRCIIDADPSTAVCDGLIAEEGNDVQPAFLPDGRIIFSSDRQTRSGQILTDESKPRFKALDEDDDQFSFQLHVMNDDGSELRQVSYNPSHDLYPKVLSNSFSGQVLFSRWDNSNQNSEFNLYKMNPDGSDVEILYGSTSHDSGRTNNGDNDARIQFSDPEEMQDGRILVLARPFTGTFNGGDLVIIDSDRFVNLNQPVYSLQGLNATAQEVATVNPISADNELSLGGRYSSAYPLWDGSNRILVSKSTCTLRIEEELYPCIEPYLSNELAEEASPAYGLWLYDRSNDSEKVLIAAQTGQVITGVTALQARDRPSVIVDESSVDFDSNLQQQELGILSIRSVYDFGNEQFDGCFEAMCSDAEVETVTDLGDPAQATAAQRPARFIRLTKHVSLPDEDDPDLPDAPELDREAFGPQRSLGMKEIIGYTPVQPDGSVKVIVPADIPLQLSVLDAQGYRISDRHNNWFTVRPGQTLHCNGCHERGSNTVEPSIHQRKDAEAPSINTGVPAEGIFPNTRMPGTPDAYWGDPGETMAEVYYKRSAQVPIIDIDVQFTDDWTDPDVRTPDNDILMLYADLDVALERPLSSGCEPRSEQDFRCRITINYAQHIQPLWTLSRGDDGEFTCTACHSPVDDMAVARVPAAQLSLVEELDADDNSQRVKSYLELFNSDQGQELDEEGNLVNIQIEVPILDEDGNQIYQTDAEGNLVLDDMGNPIPLTEIIDDPNSVVQPTMSGNGARASYFIEKMTETELNANRSLSTAADTSDYLDHSGFLSVAEIRLIAEWLDIGAQYVNDPFDPNAPSD